MDLRQIREEVAAMAQGYQTPIRVSRDMLKSVGQLIWPLSYKVCPDDDLGALEAVVQRLRMSPDQATILLGETIQYLPQEQISHMAAARWYDQGLPTVQMGHKYAAALMASCVSPESVSEGVRAPWKAFVIEMPDRLLSTLNPQSGKLEDITHVLVHRLVRSDGQKTWNHIAYTTGTVNLWKHGASTRDLVDEGVKDTQEWSTYSFGLETDDRDQRVNLLISRLIVGVCLAMSSPTAAKKVGKGHRQDLRQREAGAEPMVRVFQLGKPLNLDCRPALSDYVEGHKTTKLSVQLLVRGHWKRQPYGPKASLRKWMWREPYWRGPEDAPILQRPHVMPSGH